MTNDLDLGLGQGKAGEGRLLTLGDLLRFFSRRRFTIITATIGFLLLGIIYCALATRRYKAEALVEIKRPEDALGLNHLVQGSSQAQESANPLEETITLATKEAELESESLALRVLSDLDMENTADFERRLSLNPLPYILSVFSTPASKDAPGLSLRDSPSRRSVAYQIFESHLKVQVVPGTRLLSIAYQSPDPALAAAVVNALTDDLARYNFDTRYKAVQQLSTWLADQLDSVRHQAETMQDQEAQLRRATETYTLGGTNAAGQSLVYSPLLDHLQQATQALSSAESNLFTRGAIEKIVETRDPKLISGLAGSSLASNGNPQALNSLDLIQQLQQKEAQQQMVIKQDEQRYGLANPRLIQDKAQIVAVEEALEKETGRMVDRARNDYTVAVNEERSAREAREALMRRADTVNDKTLKYEIVHQEAADTRQLYTDLNNRVREAGVLAGLQSNDMTIVSPAFTPDKPSSPRIPLVLLVALAVGCTAGVVFAGFQDVRDDKVNSVEIVESELSIPVYAVTPNFNASASIYGYGKHIYGRHSRKKKREAEFDPEVGSVAVSPIHVIASSESQYTEALRTLRTAILLSRSGQAAKTILITSSTPGEGKSTTSANLAATFARTGAKTLLVEVDLRKPILSRRVGLPASPDGLSLMLTGQLAASWAMPVPAVPNLHCIPAGQRPPDPHELIGSETMKNLLSRWKESYDLIILDGPPVLPVIDSVLLSEQADLVLVITRFGETSINSLRTTHRLLARQVRANIGAVLNAVAQGSEGYYDYYGYRHNAYRYNAGEEA